MKIRSIITITIAGFIATGLVAFKVINSEWKATTENAHITFTMPNGKHSGTISGLETTINFDPMDPKFGSIKATVKVPTINTGTPQLDNHLQTADFFDAANHPVVTFTSDSISRNDSGFVAIGKLAMRDSIHTVRIPFVFADKEKTAMIKGSLDIFAGDYGVGKKSEKGSDRVVVSIEVPLTKE
jgi:polyisoprenoid-binding protein YceI